MPDPTIPQRIPPLTWRRPALVFTPLALAAAIGWPLILLGSDGGLRQFALVAGAGVFALALTTLGAAWAFGRAPRTYREVVAHVLVAGAAAALAGPIILTGILATVGEYEREGGGAVFDLAMGASVTPLALVLGLPIALISGIMFAVMALMRPRPDEDEPRRDDVQPFR